MRERVYDIKNAGKNHRFMVRATTTGRPIIVSNCVQRSSRDVFGKHVVSLDDQGYPALWTVHDELILEAPEAEAENVLELAKRVMRIAPPEMPGLVLDCSGGIYDKYCKE